MTSTETFATGATVTLTSPILGRQRVEIVRDNGPHMVIVRGVRRSTGKVSDMEVPRERLSAS